MYTNLQRLDIGMSQDDPMRSTEILTHPLDTQNKKKMTKVEKIQFFQTPCTESLSHIRVSGGSASARLPVVLEKSLFDLKVLFPGVKSAMCSNTDFSKTTGSLGAR